MWGLANVANAENTPVEQETAQNEAIAVDMVDNYQLEVSNPTI